MVIEFYYKTICLMICCVEKYFILESNRCYYTGSALSPQSVGKPGIFLYCQPIKYLMLTLYLQSSMESLIVQNKFRYFANENPVVKYFFYYYSNEFSRFESPYDLFCPHCNYYLMRYVLSKLTCA